MSIYALAKQTESSDVNTGSETFELAVKVLHSQDSFKPCHVASEINKYVSPSGVLVSFNHHTWMMELKSVSGKTIYFAYGKVAEFFFRTYVQKNIRVK